MLSKGSTGQKVIELQNKLQIHPVNGVFDDVTDKAVRSFQKDNGLKVDGIVGPKTWNKLFSNIIKKSSRNISKIIIHCSATPEDRDYTVDNIRAAHKQRGFTDVGYHYVIYRDGSLHLGRDVNKIGAHCTGQNSNSIGVCYIGGCASDGKTSKDTRTSAQKKALVSLLKELRKLYPNATIHGHREFAAKDCPCFDVRKEYSNI